MPDAKSDFTTNLPNKIGSNRESFQAIGAIFLFKIEGDGGGVWTIDLKNDVGVHEGEHGTPDCTLTLSSDDWKQISDTPASAMQLFFQGKLKIAGNAMLATKLQQLLG